MHTNDTAIDHVEIMTVPELIDQLRRWAETYSDAKDNNDARLLRHAARVLENQYGDIVRKNEILLRQFRRHWAIILKQKRLAENEKREAEKWKRKFLRCRYRTSGVQSMSRLEYIRNLHRRCFEASDPWRKRYFKAWYRDELVYNKKANVRLPLP